MRLAPTDSTIAAVAGTVLEWTEDESGATQAYARALRYDPGLSQSPFWSTSERRLQYRAEALAASGARITTHLLHALHARGARYGLGAACIGGGQGVAVVVEAM